MNFKQFHLHPLIQEGIDTQGFTEPTPVQGRVIPEALKGRDIRACAQTGTGKTVAFVIPILHHLIKHPTSRSLVIVPTRELGSQVHKVFNQLGKPMKVKTVLILGGMKIGKQIRQLQDGAEIIVATPGRLKDHIERKTVQLRDVGTLVLDEADRMLDMGFLPDIKKILSHMPHKRQTLFFSATYPPQIQHLTAKFLKHPVTVNLAPSTPASTIDQTLYPVINEQKNLLLQSIIKQTKSPSAIIFCRTKQRVNRLTRALHESGHSVSSLHSDKSQSQRNRAIHAFSHKQIKFLIATDIASRGLDMKNVAHVINYDVPTQPEDYVHRIGRTGRAKATGEALTLVCPEEERYISEIEKLIRKHVPRRVVEGFPYKNQPRMKSSKGHNSKKPKNKRQRWKKHSRRRR